METYEKIGDTLKKITTTEVTYDLKALSTELGEIDKQLKELEKEPDEILEPNFRKIMKAEELQERKKILSQILSLK